MTGRITVLQTGEAIFGAVACAVRTFPPSEQCAFANSEGIYRIENLPAGNYAVFVNDPVQRFLENCAGDQPCTEPQLFGITPTQGLANADVAMDARFSQTFPTPIPDPTVGDASIMGTVTNGGAPAVGVQVCASGARTLVQRCTLTDAAGAYAISSLSLIHI